MTDATSDWNNNAGGSSAAPKPAGATSKTENPGLPVNEPKSFTASAPPVSPEPAVPGAPPTPAQLASEADALLRKSLETVRAQAEELKRHSADWASLRTDQAREIVDERPLTVVAAAFGFGLIVGAILSR